MTPNERRNLRTLIAGVVLVCGMAGLGFASVPLYRMFCQTTGWGGTTQRAVAAPGAVAGHDVVVRFDANVAPSLGWSFKPEQRRETVKIGERSIAFFTATNLTNHPITGTATFNVAPTKTGAYFAKIQCFCFTQQTLKPGETVRMPVIYYVDPAILKDEDARDVEEITLSYTFFPAEKADPS